MCHRVAGSVDWIMDRALNGNAKSPWPHQALAVAANRREGETLCVCPLVSAVSMPDYRGE